MMRRSLVILLALLLPSVAFAEKRVALVIGNSAYLHTPSLTNPKNDAIDMVAALRKLGFTVLDGLDLDKPSFDRKVRSFATALQGAQVGVFFFAGHGLQVAGHNYLVPIDAQLSSVSALDFEMVRLDLVHRIMEREAQTNILFLDACRNNPLARNLARVMGTRSAEVGRGLAPVEVGFDTLISFSTQPGNVALDGTGRNSPFAGSLVRHVSSSNDDLSAILIAVRNDVMKETQRKQVPWEHSSLTGRFHFNAPTHSTPPAMVPPSVPLPSEAERAWLGIRDTESIPMFETFIRRFGDSYYGDLANVRLAELKQSEAAKQVAHAATKKKAEEDARARDDAERQRISSLQREDNRRRTDPAASTPVAWRGWHECGGSKVGTTAHIRIDASGSISGFREFYPTEGDPNRASGSFQVSGQYRREGGDISLIAGTWINRPEGYGKCDFIGKVDASGQRIVGRSPGCSCGPFELQKQ